MKFMQECRRSEEHAHDKRSWEIIHEEIGFIDEGPFYDRDLIDLDGSETHLAHAMEGHGPRRWMRTQ